MKKDKKISDRDTVVNLSIPERMWANSALNNYKGNIMGLAMIMRDIVQFRISREELEEINGNVLKNNDGTETLQWNPEKEKGMLKKITLDDITLEYLRKVIADKDIAGEFTISDTHVVSLKDKLA